MNEKDEGIRQSPTWETITGRPIPLLYDTCGAITPQEALILWWHLAQGEQLRACVADQGDLKALLASWVAALPVLAVQLDALKEAPATLPDYGETPDAMWPEFTGERMLPWPLPSPAHDATHCCDPCGCPQCSQWTQRAFPQRDPRSIRVFDGPHGRFHWAEPDGWTADEWKDWVHRGVPEGGAVSAWRPEAKGKGA